MMVEIVKLINNDESVIAIVGDFKTLAIGLYILGQLTFGLMGGSLSCKVLH